MSAALLKLNLGCGWSRREGYLGVDIGDYPTVDVRQDALLYLKSLPANSVQEVYSAHFLEHLDAEVFLQLLKEINRVLVPGGDIKFLVPHYSHPYYYSDPTHRITFGVHTFSYLCETSCLHRKVPDYARIPGWTLKSVRLHFIPYAQPRIWRFRIPMPSDLLNIIVNLNPLFVELFERYLAGICAIYEIEYHIRKTEVRTTAIN
jgi:predicted SAM-dependent methyltransferase